ncbi:MAG: membrane protein insertase YidC [Balneolaceae bacterium]
MDRNTVTGLILILVVMVAWAYFTMPSEQELRQQQAEQARQDSIAAAQADSSQMGASQLAGDDSSQVDQPSSKGQHTLQGQETAPQEMGMFSEASIADTVRTMVNTPLYQATFTNVGGGPSQILLKDYKTWDKKPVRMVKDTTRSAYSVGFLTNENYNVETNQLVFEPLTDQQSISLGKEDSTQIRYALNISETQRLVYTYTLYGDSHQIELKVDFEGLEKNIIGGTVDFGWEPALNLTEKSPSTEERYISAYAYTGGEMEQLKLSESGRKKQDYNGKIDWVATRTKFFTQLIKTKNQTESALLIGEESGSTDKGNAQFHYQSYLSTDLSPSGSAAFQMYVGPLAYNQIKVYNEHAYDMVNVGYSWLRWFSDPLVRYVIIPFFGFMGEYMNYGLAIILFAILVKLVLYPLTKKSYESMAAMKELQPQLQELKEKYEDDPEKQQKATMKLYKEAGVNPLGGCLPNLLQLPILVTLWRFFQNSILIRQQSFLWAGDLSAPDHIIHLPFSIPFLGDALGGFVLLMTLAMLVQSKVTGGMGPGGGGGSAGGPNMKALQYFFPVMLLFIFNNFAAGLSLYYLIYNVVSILQQLAIYRQIDSQKEAPAKA